MYKEKHIEEVASLLGLSRDNILLFGNDKAKIKNVSTEIKGNLILVTAMNPTPYGEGKTTVSIGLLDALRRLNENAVAVLREPSMGPVFGMKGGATGGGKSLVIPTDEINLHFTGDFHAITSANNLICAAVDNHLFQGNILQIEEVVFHRCLDMNDRALREIDLGTRKEKFNITAASEIMSIFTLATSEDDLKKKLGNIIVGFTKEKQPIYTKHLKLENALVLLLKEAFKPNLVQTIEGNPVIIHGGPFANISHGCNSIQATKLGLSVSDYVITEAGFGSDLGAEKFFDIKCRKAALQPKCAVIVATIKALKYNGGCPKENILEENIEFVKEGLPNLKRHIENMKKFGVGIVVCLNRYDTDTKQEIQIVEDFCDKLNVSYSESTAFLKGGEGAVDLAIKVKDLCQKENEFQVLYEDKLTIQQKIEKVTSEIYRSSSVTYSDQASQTLELIYKLELDHFPICIAKTPYSFTDDSKILGAPEKFNVHVKDLEIYHGAGFIVVLLNDIMTMPGLSKSPNYEQM